MHPYMIYSTICRALCPDILDAPLVLRSELQACMCLKCIKQLQVPLSELLLLCILVYSLPAIVSTSTCSCSAAMSAGLAADLCKTPLSESDEYGPQRASLMCPADHRRHVLSASLTAKPEGASEAHPASRPLQRPLRCPYGQECT